MIFQIIRQQEEGKSYDFLDHTITGRGKSCDFLDHTIIEDGKSYDFLDHTITVRRIII